MSLTGLAETGDELRIVDDLGRWSLHGLLDMITGTWLGEEPERKQWILRNTRKREYIKLSEVTIYPETVEGPWKKWAIRRPSNVTEGLHTFRWAFPGGANAEFKLGNVTTGHYTRRCGRDWITMVEGSTKGYRREEGSQHKEVSSRDQETLQKVGQGRKSVRLLRLLGRRERAGYR